MDEMVKLPEAAKLLGVSYQIVLRLAKSGELDAVKFGPRSWRVSKAKLDAFKLRNTVSKPGEAMADNTPGQCDN